MRSANLLGDPKTGFGALVFFQLRSIVEDLPSAALDFRRGSDAPAGSAGSREAQGGRRGAKNARLADVDQRLRGAAAAADSQRRALADAQNEISATDRVLALLQTPPPAEIAGVVASTRS